MENQDFTSPHHHHMDASRPSLGFPLGTALLLIIIFCLSGVFSCCYHWEKLRSLRQSFASQTDLEADSIPDTPAKIITTHPTLKKNQSESLPVLMPGDNVPKFIALPCPCEPPRLEKVVVDVQMPIIPSPSVIVYNHIGRFGVHYSN